MRKVLKLLAVAVVGVVILFVIVSVVGPPKPPASGPASRADENGEVAAAGDRSPPAPQTAEERLRAALVKMLGRANRDVSGIKNPRRLCKGYPKVTEMRGGRGVNIQVQWVLNDNLTAGLVKYGARADVVDVLRTIHQSGVPYARIYVEASIGLVDKFGNSSETIVVEASYLRPAVGRINWKNFLSENVYDIADSVSLHPTMK